MKISMTQANALVRISDHAEKHGPINLPNVTQYIADTLLTRLEDLEIKGRIIRPSCTSGLPSCLQSFSKEYRLSIWEKDFDKFFVLVSIYPITKTKFDTMIQSQL